MGMIINPYAFGVAQSYLLDTYSGAAAAYSLRKLSSTYTGDAIRVRRSSDNTEQNIGFDGSGNLDTTALTTFVGANNGFVTTWYDQSGNSRNVTQSIAAYQPRIVNSGVVDTHLGKPSPYFGYNSTGNMSLRYVTNPVDMWNTSNMTVLGVTNKISAGGAYTYSRIYGLCNRFSADFNSVNSMIGMIDDANLGGFNPGLSTYSNSAGSFQSYTYNSSILFWSQKIGGASPKLYIGTNNNSLISANTAAGNIIPHFLTLGNFNDDGSINSGLKGYINEIIFYTSDQTSNRTGINSNINTFYSIY